MHRIVECHDVLWNTFTTQNNSKETQRNDDDD